jgi:hypothetical protein
MCQKIKLIKLAFKRIVSRDWEELLMASFDKSKSKVFPNHNGFFLI